MLTNCLSCVGVSLVSIASTGVTQAYESLAILEGTSSLAQQALHSGAKLKMEDTHNLNAYFNKVTFSLSIATCCLAVDNTSKSIKAVAQGRC